MALVNQGKITKLTASGTNNIKANVADAAGIVTIDAVVPERLQPEGRLSVGTAVAYVVFDDNTSLILSRCDGTYS